MNNTNIEVIKLPPERWQEFKTLRLQALQSDPQAFGSSYAKELAYPDEKWQQRCASAYAEDSNWMVFAQDNNQLIGMMGAWQSDQDKENGLANIFGVYVAPEGRGKGISKSLLQFLLDELKKSGKVNKLKLSVNKDQTAAVKLYQSFNFNVAGQENVQLGDGNYYDEYLMERDI